MTPQDIIIDEKTVRIIDLMEQVKRVNEMIAMHRNESGNLLMAKQYEYKRAEFVQQLEEILKDYHLTIKVAEEAA